MQYQLCYFLNIILMVILTILPLTSAPWNQNDPPDTPLLNDKRSCFDWLIYNKFDADNVTLNRTKALNRDPKLDRKAYMWSVGYAYLLSGLNLASPKPFEFCLNRTKNSDPVDFVSLEEAKLTCQDWIYLYGYVTDGYYRLNWDIARFRNFLMDDHISHWVASYGNLLSSLSVKYGLDDNATIHPAEFCFGLGLNINELLTLSSRDTPSMTCEGWIKVHGFTDDPVINFDKAQRGFDPRFEGQIHYLAKKFGSDMLAFGRPIDVKPQKHCSLNRFGPGTPVPFYPYMYV